MLLIREEKHFYSKSKKHCFNIQTLCSIFDTYVNSILSYGSEIWGFHRAQDVEKVHLSFCKKNIRCQHLFVIIWCMLNLVDFHCILQENYEF